MNPPLLESCSILVVDDDRDVLLAAEIVLKKHFRSVVTADRPDALPGLLAGQSFDVVLLDMNFTPGATTGREGLGCLRTIERLSPDTKVILMTAYGRIETAVSAMKEGATDFVVKPWDNDKLVATVAATLRFSQAARAVRALESKQRVLNQDIGRGAPLIGDSPAMRSVAASIEKVAQTDANVLILGENGTGKEVVARAIHRASRRAGQTFVHVDLGAITETLFETELFGHKRGAFTDAREDRPGRFEIANGGTLFLDEIGNLSLAMQAKLLGVLESRLVSRVGSDAPIPVDARILCATNLSVEDLLDGRRFRQDLLYRVNTVEIHVPPLRERVEDLPALVRHYATAFARKYDKSDLAVDAGTIEGLKRYRWPGNVRELVHSIERGVIMAEGPELGLAELLVPQHAAVSDARVELNLEALEKRAIRQALDKHAGNMTKAARELGLGRTTLYRKMARHDL
ncbi:MAG: sigma-54-dependent Fis family transcriptional regulator [Gammaproteobacteria bacterium]|nr:sigma-54-dependent Fis family transcriptional regulator [Gammaproteobacteria bacterium]